MKTVMQIGIVSPAPATARALARWVAAGSRHQVSWIAGNGMDAVGLCAAAKTDLVLLDLRASDLTALDTTRRIMTESPCAILLVTESVKANATLVFEAMGAGALDAVDIAAPDSTTPAEKTLSFLAKINLLARLVGETDRDHGLIDRGRPVPLAARSNRLIAIGASAGGPAALATILRNLPKDFPAAIAVVQHVDEQFAAGLIEWLSQYSNLPVRMAREGEMPQAGTVLIAGGSDHLVFTSPDRLGYTAEPSHHVYRPSVDVFFDSISRTWRGEVVGVLLTGMGRDGAHGLKTLRDHGSHTIAQDQASSALYGMPKAAAALNAATEILPIDGIAPRLVEIMTVGAGRAHVRRLG